MSTEENEIHFDESPYRNEKLVPEKRRVSSRPTEEIYLYEHEYPGITRSIAVSSQRTKENKLKEIQRKAQLLYHDAEGNAFAQFEHKKGEADIRLMVGEPKNTKVEANKALILARYCPEEPAEFALQANTPDFSSIEQYTNWEEYMPLLRYYLTDPEFPAKSVDVSERVYTEGYEKFIEEVNLSQERFLDRLLLRDIGRHANTLFEWVTRELFPGEPDEQARSWDTLHQFGMMADLSAEILDIALKAYEAEDRMVSMQTLFTYVGKAEVLRNVIDRVTKRIAAFRKMPVSYSLFCTAWDDNLHIVKQKRLFDREELEIIEEEDVAYGSDIPLPDGHSLTIQRKGNLLYVVCTTTKYGERAFRNWEAILPATMPFFQMQKLLLTRYEQIKHAKSLAPVIFQKPL